MARSGNSRDESYLRELFASEITRRQMLKATGGVTFAAAGGASLAAFLASCGASAAAKSTITVAVEDLGTQTPDPEFAYSHGSMRTSIWTTLGDPLIGRDLHGNLQPHLATDYSISSDHLTWTFTLRQGVKMHDGSPFTWQDVKTANDRVLKYPGDFVLNEPSASVITSITPAGSNQVVITTKEPHESMLDDLATPIATNYYNRVGDAYFRKHPIAAGPFKFVSQQLNASMTFERFDQYYDKSRLVNFKTLVLQLLPDESTRIAALQTGAVDAIHGLSQAGVKQLRGSKQIKIVTIPNSAIRQILLAALNPNHPTPEKLASPVHDVRVRKAMLYAIDRASIIKNIYGGGGELIHSFNTPVTRGYNPALKEIPYDPSMAKQLLQQAGYPSFNFILVSKNADAVDPEVLNSCQAIANYWDAVGIKTTYQPMDPALQASLQDAWTFAGGFVLGLNANELYEPNYLANQFFARSSGNVTVSDPKLSQFAEQLNTTFDESARNTLARQEDDYLYETQPVLGLWMLSAYAAIGPNLTSWQFQDGNGEAGPFWTIRAA